jgi:hypothetical protein
MEKAMADLKSTTGYDGSGVWTEGPKTVVNYTDTQGKKRHQELNVYFVHADQDAKSPVVYEVLEDPKSGEMMFTIRASNHKDIKGLNEKQAALVRQAWAYLLAADPQVMQKFWRVNKVGGVGEKILPMPATNDREKGLILYNPNSLDNNEMELIISILLQESYELYGGQFGWGEGYIYKVLPPDCLNTHILNDAAERVLAWITKYGDGLLSEILLKLKELSRIQRYGVGESNKGNACQPQIPFDP